jgi:hypothetical protein
MWSNGNSFASLPPEIPPPHRLLDELFPGGVPVWPH